MLFLLMSLVSMPAHAAGIAEYFYTSPTSLVAAQCYETPNSMKQEIAEQIKLGREILITDKVALYRTSDGKGIVMMTAILKSKKECQDFLKNGIDGFTLTIVNIVN